MKFFASLSAIPQIRTELDQVKEEMASVSARLQLAELGIKNHELSITSQSASISALISSHDSLFMIHDSIDVATLSAQFATFSDNLKVIGKTQLAETSIGGGLIVGLLHFDDLKAEISALTGQVTINSNLNVIGDATVSGQLKVGKGLLLKDKTTGEDYCVQVDNGEIIKTKGQCQ